MIYTVDTKYALQILPSAPMSSFYILGFFQLKAGRRVAVTKPNSNFPTHYAHYSTNVWCLDNTTIPADIRVFTASTTPLVPDGMVAFAVCTAQSTATPPTANSLASNALALDALMFVVLPGNPESDTYNVRAVYFLHTHPHVIEGPLTRRIHFDGVWCWSCERKSSNAQ
jgi:hypothetical protein